jgi:hypothetical protein
MNIKSLQLILILTLASFLTASAQWLPVGPPSFTGSGVMYTSMAIGKNDTPFVAYRDNSAAGGGRLGVKKYAAGSWASVGTTWVNADAVQSVSLAIDTATGHLFVACYDSLESVIVFEYNGTDWDSLGTSGFVANNQLGQIQMLVAGDGTPYIGYIDGNQSYKANMMKYSGGSWAQVGAANFSSQSGTYITFALDHHGVPYAASQASGYPETIEVQKFDGNSWVAVGGVFDTSSYATQISLAIDTNNNPYVALTHHDAPYQTAVWGYIGAAWHKIGQNVTAGDAEELNLKATNQNTLIISYIDYTNTMHQISVSRYTPAGWNLLGNQDFSAGTAEYSSLAVSSKGDVYVAYKDDATGYGATVKEYLHTTAINTVSTLAAFKLYPNPNNGRFEVSFEQSTATDMTIAVTDMMGRTVWQDTRTATGSIAIDLFGITKGLYTLQVKTNDGISNSLVEIR